jgi:hypothetical protein
MSSDRSKAVTIFMLAKREGVERVLAIEGRPANVEVDSRRASG